MSVKIKSKLQAIEPSPLLKIFDAMRKYDDLINLGIGEPDLDPPKEALEAAIDAVRDGYSHYPPMTGYLDLKEAICGYWERHGLKYEPQQVIITSGGVQALNLILSMFIEPGDEVIVADPCFPTYVSQVEFLGGKAVAIPVREDEGFNPTAARIESSITSKTKVLILNSPGNPTGAVLSREEMLEIAAVVEKYDLYVISDEIYEAMVYDCEHIPFAATPGMAQRTFTVAGFSKTYAMTGWRLGYIMCAQEFIPTLSVLFTDTVMGVNAVAQRAAYAAVKKCDYFIKELRDLYKRRVAHASLLINETPGLSCNTPKGSFYIMINISQTGMGSEAFASKMLEEARVVVMPGASFGGNSDNFVRISCNCSETVLDCAFDRMRAAMSRN